MREKEREGLKILRSPVRSRLCPLDTKGLTSKLLLACRLVEAGVRCVSVSFSDFDIHSDNFPRMRQQLPILDHELI